MLDKDSRATVARCTPPEQGQAYRSQASAAPKPSLVDPNPTLDRVVVE